LVEGGANQHSPAEFRNFWGAGSYCGGGGGIISGLGKKVRIRGMGRVKAGASPRRNREVARWTEKRKAGRRWGQPNTLRSPVREDRSFLGCA